MHGGLHSLAYISEKSAWFANFDSSVQSFARRAYELLRILIDRPYRVCLIEICMESCREVDQNPLTGVPLREHTVMINGYI